VTELFHAESPVRGLFTLSRVDSDFENLLARMRQRAYTETTPALAYFWLRTVYVSGYNRGEWNRLDWLLLEALNTGALAAHAAILAALRSRIRRDGFLTGDAPPPPRTPPLSESPAPGAGSLVAYFIRLLSEWLPKEIAQLQIDESEGQEIPSLCTGRALERLLVRQRLSRRSLEFALDPSFFSPRFVYPCHYEILRDVALFLLGRTAPLGFSAGSACLLCSAPEARLFDDYAEAVAHATVTGGGDGEQLEVPVTLSQSRALRHEDGFRMASIVVTMDGWWWKAHNFRSGRQNVIVYRAGGHLRIDFSGAELRLQVPWLERRVSWPGPARFPTVELFGREWRTIQWDQDRERTWLALASSAVLPVARLAPGVETSLRRCRPAFVDMTWTALQSALSSALAGGDGNAVEQLRRDEVIPLGRSLVALAQTLAARDRTPEAVEGRLVAVAFHASALGAVYGKVPWRILPKRVRGRLLGSSFYPVLEERLRAVFDNVPAVRRAPRFWSWLQHSPKRVA
jgi:hypothetical protein